MKICPQCSAGNAEEAVECHKCGFRGAGTAPETVQATLNSPRTRPDGTILRILGWVMMAFGAYLFLMAFQEIRGYGGRSSMDGIVGAGLAFTLASYVFNTGLALALIGQVVRALWFLPGPQHKAHD